jgi:hypothetical protein
LPAASEELAHVAIRRGIVDPRGGSPKGFSRLAESAERTPENIGNADFPFCTGDGN